MKPVRIRVDDEHEADGVRRTVLRVAGNTVVTVNEVLGANGHAVTVFRGQMPADQWLWMRAGAGAEGVPEPPSELGGEG